MIYPDLLFLAASAAYAQKCSGEGGEEPGIGKVECVLKYLDLDKKTRMSAHKRKIYTNQKPKKVGNSWTRKGGGSSFLQ